jgi:transposase
LHNTVQRYVKRMLREQRAVRAHYGFSVRFCNPESGHEKGNVEARVGYNPQGPFCARVCIR